MKGKKVYQIRLATAIHHEIGMTLTDTGDKNSKYSFERLSDFEFKVTQKASQGTFTYSVFTTNIQWVMWKDDDKAAAVEGDSRGTQTQKSYHK